MSNRHLTMIWEDAYYDSGSKAKLLVALAIADSARSEDGRAWPSIEYLARKARTSIRGVQESCRDLEQAGRLITKINGGPEGTNLYTVIDVPPQPIHPRSRAPKKAPDSSADEAPPDCGQTVTNRTEPESTQVNPLPPDRAEGGHKAFIDGWMSYSKLRTKTDYPFGPRDAKAVKTLLDHFKTVDALKTFIKACHARVKEGYPFDSTDALYDIANGIARLEGALSKPPRVRGNETAAERKTRQEGGRYAIPAGGGPKAYSPDDLPED